MVKGKKIRRRRWETWGRRLTDIRAVMRSGSMPLVELSYFCYIPNHMAPALRTSSWKYEYHLSGDHTFLDQPVPEDPDCPRVRPLVI